MVVQAKTPSPGPKLLINKQLRQGGFDLKGTTRQALSKAEVSARTRLWRLVSQGGLTAKLTEGQTLTAGLWLTNWGQCASLYRVFSGGSLRMRAGTKPYPPASVVGGNRHVKVRRPARPPRLACRSSRLGNRPTRPVAKPSRVQKGHPLWHMCAVIIIKMTSIETRAHNPGEPVSLSLNLCWRVCSQSQ